MITLIGLYDIPPNSQHESEEQMCREIANNWKNSMCEISISLKLIEYQRVKGRICKTCPIFFLIQYREGSALEGVTLDLPLTKV